MGGGGGGGGGGGFPKIKIRKTPLFIPRKLALIQSLLVAVFIMSISVIQLSACASNLYRTLQG